MSSTVRPFSFLSLTEPFFLSFLCSLKGTFFDEGGGGGGLDLLDLKKNPLDGETDRLLFS